MAVIVEDGTGVAGANSVQSVANWKTYADESGWDYSAKTDDQIGSALIRAMRWLDATYEARLPGVRTYEGDQALAQPRKAGVIEYGEYVADDPDTVAGRNGLYIETDVVPAAWINAHAEATWRELQKPGSLSPDLKRGGDVRRYKAGPVEIEYGPTAASSTTFGVIDGLLANLLVTAQSSGFTATAVRA